jgi:hypothetical protein
MSRCVSATFRYYGAGCGSWLFRGMFQCIADLFYAFALPKPRETKSSRDVSHIPKGVSLTRFVLTIGLPFAYKVMNAPSAFKQEGEKSWHLRGRARS